MLNHFLHTARAAVSDINNHLKTNADICMDFMMRLDMQPEAVDGLTGDVNTGPNKITTMVELMDIHWQDIDPRLCLEENY